MGLPNLTAEFGIAPAAAARHALRPGAIMPASAGGGIEPMSCSVLKKIACGGAFVACGASCLLGPEICVPCLSAVGATDCLNCLLDW